MQEQLRKQKEDAAQQKLEVEAACKDLFPTAVLVGFQSLGLGLAHHGCKVRKAVKEPWNPYLADVRLGGDANLPELSLKALKCLNERLKSTSTFQCCHSFELHRFQCSIRTIQELQKERVREQELVQKQKVPGDLTDYLWNFGLIWSKPHGTVVSLKDNFKVIPFQITIPVAHVTDVEFAECASCCSTSVRHFYRPSLCSCHPQEELKQLKEQKELQQDHPGLRGEGLVMPSGCQQGSSYLSVEFYNVQTQFKPEPN